MKPIILDLAEAFSSPTSASKDQEFKSIIVAPKELPLKFRLTSITG